MKATVAFPTIPRRFRRHANVAQIKTIAQEEQDLDAFVEQMDRLTRVAAYVAAALGAIVVVAQMGYWRGWW